MCRIWGADTVEWMILYYHPCLLAMEAQEIKNLLERSLSTLICCDVIYRCIMGVPASRLDPGDISITETMKSLNTRLALMAANVRKFTIFIIIFLLLITHPMETWMF